MGSGVRVAYGQDRPSAGLNVVWLASHRVYRGILNRERRHSSLDYYEYPVDYEEATIEEVAVA